MMFARQPTMRDVAAAAGVSLKTVSRVVNDESHIHAKTRAKVMQAIHELGFRPNEIARSLRPGRSSATIGLLIEDIANPFYSGIARGVEEVAHAHHYMVVMASNEKIGNQEQEMVSALLRRRVDGLLLVPASHHHSYLQTEIERGIPITFIDRPPEDVVCDTVLLDNRGGTRSGIELLLQQGHRRIGYIGGDLSIFTGTERLAAYHEALSAWDIALDPTIILANRHVTEEAERAATQLLTLADPPTALFADNNRMTVGVLRAFAALQRSVALVGFDDIELGDMMPYPFTVIKHNPQVIGQMAANLLFDRLATPDLPPQRVIFPTILETYHSMLSVAATVLPT